jgi:ribosomal protein S12 methylthiotransferase accessory factor
MSNGLDAVSHAPVHAGVEAPPVFFRGVAHRGRKGFVGATHRTCSPEETLVRVTPLLPAAGITRLADVTGLDRIGIPTVLAIRPNAPTLANASGKGFDLPAAKASAAMEGIEIHHAEQLLDGFFEAPFVQLEKNGLAIPRECLPLARQSLFRTTAPERWQLGWDILGQREVAVPFECVSMGSSPTRGSFQTGSNGLASGNVFLEAVCAGLAEVIERDAVTCAALRTGGDIRRLPRLDLTTIPYAHVQELLARLAERGLRAALFDCTSDTMVPTYQALLVDEAVPSTGTYGGYGAHLDREVAMIRALTEAVQSRSVYIAGSRDDLSALEHARLHRRADDRAIEMVCANGGLDASSLVSGATETFEGDCHALVAAVAAAGLDHVVIVDLTRPDFGVPVVRVIVPGLEGTGVSDRYAPGPRARTAVADGAGS